MNRALALVLMTAAFSAAADDVSVKSVEQLADGTLKVVYTLSAAPKVVTFDITTNGVSIGDANVYRHSPPQGDVSRLIPETGDYEVTWNPDLAWPNHPKVADIRVALSAWEPSDPPDYLVADLLAAKSVRYYTSSNALPGGVLGNGEYRLSKLVMRRIHAANVDWTMGTGTEAHAVRMASDYYMGVFPITQAQWYLIRTMDGGYHTSTGRNCEFTAEGYWQKRIADNICYNLVRVNRTSTADDENTHYPADPGKESYLGVLRDRTGVKFDLPGEAQWEFACRGGYAADDVWGDGTPIGSDPSLTIPGRIKTNGGLTNSSYGVSGSVATDRNGTPTAGSYAPNGYGLYDMHGGVMEWCLDWYESDISRLSSGEINANGKAYAAGGSGTPTARVTRGGCWFYGDSYARSARRDYSGANDGGNVAQFGGGGRGFRVACPVPAEQ